MGEQGPRSAGEPRASGLELRLERGGVHVAFLPEPVLPGVELVALSLEVPGVEPGVELERGALQFRNRLCDLDRLEIALGAAALSSLLGRVGRIPGVTAASLALRTGFAEGRGTLAGGAAFTFKAGVVGGAGHAFAVALLEPRVYGAASVCAAELPWLLVRAGSARRADLPLPAIALEPLPVLLRYALPTRGWKVPRTAGVHLAGAAPSPGRLGLVWERGVDPARPPPDLASDLEGARAFAEPERHLAEGRPDLARDAYVARWAEAARHPFSAGRLVALAAGHPALHDRALELAAELLRTWEGFAPALLARAHVHAARGDAAAASAAYAELAETAARRGEESSALAASDACFALGPRADPAACTRAADTALGLHRDHLPALRALVALDEAADPERLLRACRRLAAYAPTPRERAEAHVRLGALLAGSDPHAARLHLDHALRLAPADPAVLTRLARACEQAGDHLRAARALERARELDPAPGALQEDAAPPAEEPAGASERAARVEALLSRAALARDAGEADAAARLLEAGQEALASGLGERGEDALREALRLGLPREDGAQAWASLCERARGLGDRTAEREALRSLAELLPVAERPGALLRLSALAADDGDLEAARDAAERARVLAPGDAGAVERCKALAEQQGDRAALPDLLAALGALDPARRGPLLLERARLLAGAGRIAEADAGMAEALALLPPDATLAADHARLRLAHASVLRDRAPTEPLEAHALRLEAPELRARALADAAARALELGDPAAALRCARRAFESAPDLPGVAHFLARVLYRMGSTSEAIALHRSLLASDVGAADGEGAADVCREAAELATELEDVPLALAALDRLLEIEPHDVEAALRRFALDPDRRRAVTRLADAAQGTRAARLRAGALARAAVVAAAELGDAELSAQLLARARAAAGEHPAALALVERLRLDGAREAAARHPGQVPRELLDALRALASACDASGQASEADALLRERAALAAEHGLDEEAARDLLDLERRALLVGDLDAAAARAREAGVLFLERQADPAAAEAALRRALARRPDDAEAWRALEAAVRARGGGEEERATLLLDATRALREAGDLAGASATLRSAFEAAPWHDPTFSAALRDAAGDVDRLDAVLAARARAVLADAAGCHRARADALLACGRGDDAVSAYQECLEHAPDDADVLAHLAEALASRDGDASARPYDARLVELSERRPGAVAGPVEASSRRRLGVAAARGGRADQATAHLARALALAPADAESWSLLCELAASRAEHDEEGALAIALRMAEAAPDDPARREALALGAEISARSGDRGPLAGTVLEALAAATLGGDEAADDLAERAVGALARAGENARAEALVALAARTSAGARRAAWLKRLAAAAAARGDAAAARAAREEALAADPSDSELRAVHLADLERAGDPAALARALGDALGAPGADLPALSLRRAHALVAVGDTAGAEASFGAVVGLGPDAPGWDEAVAGLSRLLEARGDDAALARLDLVRAGRAADGPARATLLLAAARRLERSDLPAARDAAARAHEADPDAAAPWEALARIHRAEGATEAAARALLGVSIRCEGAVAAAAATEAAKLLDAAGRGDDARRALLAAIAASPGFPPACRELARRAREAGEPDAAARHLAAVDPSALGPDERVEHRRELARLLTAAGSPDAEAAWTEVFHADASDAEAFDRLAAGARARGHAERWLALAAQHEGALSGGADVQRRCDLRCERAALLQERGQLEAAEGAWRAALALDPDHCRSLSGLATLYQNRWGEASAPSASAAPGRSLDAALARAREAPFDEEALSDLAEVARELSRSTRARAPRLGVLARTAEALAGFASGHAWTHDAAPLPIPREAQDRAASPLARSAAARLLALLAPWIEPLFASDPSRRSVSGQDRMGADRAPALLALLEGAREALESRPFAALLSDEAGCTVSVESTLPPSIVVGASVASALTVAEQRFLLARAVVLVDLGWALVGGSSGPDVEVVCELACRFAGRAEPRPATPPRDARLASWLEALERTAPGPARETAARLAVPASRDLATLEPRALAAGLRQTASRVALLHAGNAGAALAALLASEERLQRLSRDEALSDPELVDLATFALSDEHLALRAAAEAAA